MTLTKTIALLLRAYDSAYLEAIQTECYSHHSASAEDAKNALDRMIDSGFVVASREPHCVLCPDAPRRIRYYWHDRI